MDVQLYVYDLSKGFARIMSMGLVGIQIDAVYHTSIVLGGVEYFYGAGVQTCVPGQTHHGRPMEVDNLGKTELPMDVVLTYLESLKEQYTAENYDLFAHNCNNFSHDFAMFLVGKGIPDHITSLPNQVLNTPFGAMMKNQLDASMRSVTQAAVPPEKNPVVQAEAAAARKDRAQHQANGNSSRAANTEVARAAVEHAVQQATQSSQTAQPPSPRSKPRKLETRSAVPDETAKSKHPRKLEVRSGANEESKGGDSSSDGAPPKKLPRKLEVRDEERVINAHGSVRNVTSASVLEDLLASAKESCAVVFFTSSTCAPCKLAYPTYDTLAAENPKIPFIKVDINQAGEIAQRYAIRATPTFKTFLHGQKSDEWQGANPAQLKANVDLLIQAAFPPHPHLSIRLPTLQFGSLKPVTFTKIPPLDKLVAKMGDKGKDPGVISLTTFLSARSADNTKTAPPLPDLPAIARFLRSAPTSLGKDSLFTAYDLLRCGLLDSRFSSWFAEESSPSDSETLSLLLSHVLSLISSDTCPYNLRLVTIQLACNLFSTPLFAKSVMKPNDSEIPSLMTRLASESLLAETSKPAIRAAATSLAFNLAATNYRLRREEEDRGEALPEASQVELAAGLLELVSTEAEAHAALGDGKDSNSEVLRLAVTAFGYLIYCAPSGGEVGDLCGALDARGTVEKVRGVKGVEKVAGEVLAVLDKGW